MRKRGPIALLTDFGTRDPFVGVMKGVILSIQPSCQMVDITHQIPPQDIQEAAFALRSARGYFPRGTIFLCVVDPGVGTTRRPIVVESGGQLFVAPDNGLLSLVEPIRKMARIENKQLFLRPVSRTFHGRDIFAPVAAHLARGIALGRVGPSIRRIRRLDLPTAIRKGGQVLGEVIRIDRFGNLITNLRPGDLPASSRQVFRVGRKTIRGISRSYEEGASGEPLAILGSEGFIEIAVRDGSAMNALRVRRGARVTAGSEEPKKK
ncbi:MAG: SAM-dependent chlorinase/fluorinase [Planctomycetota bacterium]|nr:SAM-dependent chlorinase/fluorinase [Planctomycetota bacterium]